MMVFVTTFTDGLVTTTLFLMLNSHLVVGLLTTKCKYGLELYSDFQFGTVIFSRISIREKIA